MGPTTLPTLTVPTDPVQPSEPEPPLAVQVSALSTVQVSVVEPPVSTAGGAERNRPTDGSTGAASTLTLTELGALVPPGPVQVNV
jgi:hypothetical protein